MSARFISLVGAEDRRPVHIRASEIAAVSQPLPDDASYGAGAEVLIAGTSSAVLVVQTVDRVLDLIAAVELRS